MEPNNTTVRAAFQAMLIELVRMKFRWRSAAPSGEIWTTAREVTRWMEMVLASRTDGLDHEMIVHGAYVRAIAFGQMVRRATDCNWADLRDLAPLEAAVADLLDAFTPFICLADDALRRVMLDGEPLDSALARIEHELR